ncbi:BtpA/SgcQ family protein [Thermoproteus tenax]|uniref:BtpA-like predicted TIM-barrel enzyme n=1 Tax=Thermoproteus tenax (strain ATCC 35583 / DSM 2078 / JCM 9277 / NBRC 100435 / Kra 1) TaxID=768679 RepID=G4RN43_THETK|nr:BtpA/SgcQ family protein [Thermoproteus tenax]CCC80987.1 btpA-like predicted TIM-barrel enzyme [Thermoproteus tenax Kra 1]
MSLPRIVGVVHLPPLPGSPRYSGDFSSIVEFAVENARRLEDAGFDGIILENFNDAPFKPRARDPETIAAMAIAAREVRRAVSVQLGVNILRNSGPEAAAVASLSGASFIRVNALCEVVSAPEGLLEPVAREIAEVQARLKSAVKILADVHVKHGWPLHGRPLREVAEDCAERGGASAVVVSGGRTGLPPEPSQLAELAGAGLPVYVGSGTTPDNLKSFRGAYGFIVGTYLKDERGRIDPKKAKIYVEAARDALGLGRG